MVNPFDLQESDVDIRDIAHALSNQCRFGGHTRPFYSVAAHCCLASLLAPEELALEVLMHDCDEAYFVDLPRPIKHRFPEYVAAGVRVQDMIFRKYGLTYPFPPMVHELDTALAVEEAHAMMENGITDWHPDLKVLVNTHVPDFSCTRGASNAEVESMFLSRFNTLMHRRVQ